MSKKTVRWKELFKKKKLIILVLAAGAGLVTFGIYSVKGTPAKGGQEQKSAVQETQAQTGSISNTIVGTGNLELQEGDTITIPSGIIVEEVKVENGDSVSKGDVLAEVNAASVLRAMESVQEQIDALDEEIEESKDDTDAETIKSKVEGRVKKIFVQEGQDITDCMAEQGALMLLSIDGYLAVEIQTNAELSKGDAVTIARSDGSSKEGTVETVSNGRCTILCSDSGIGMEEDITVSDTQGNALGTGRTYIHQQLAVTAAAGTVEEICVSEDQKVYTDTALLTVDNGGQSLEYQEQMTKRQELAESLQKLIKLSKSGTITAEADGIIQSVNISAESSQKEEGTENLQISQNTVALVGSVAEIPESEQETEEKVEEELLTLEVTDFGASGRNTVVVETPKTGAKPQIEINTEDGSYHGAVSWKPEDEKFKEKTSYQASINLYAGEGYYFTGESVSKVKTGVLSGVTVSEDGKNLSMQITYPFTEAAEKEEQKDQKEEQKEEENKQEKTSEEDSGEKKENQAEPVEEIQNKNVIENENAQIQKQAALQGSSGNVSGTVNAASVSAKTSGEQEDTESSDSSSEVAAFTLVAGDAMVLSVNVDELDINAVEEQQQAKITLDSMEGETFAGTVIKVGSSASSSSGGVAKYTVKISIPRDERMKEGMNASAVITIEERENVVTIPVNALQERGNRVFVYTEADSEGNLSGEKEITTGLSDGDMVEITEGLSDGDKIYYQKTGNISQKGFEGMEGRPNMEDMPQGGPPEGKFGGGMPGRQE